MNKNLKEIQTAQKNWADYNFDEKHGGTYAFEGMVEELGELSRARLKHRQGIRGYETEEARDAAERDAVGDILMYMLDYCSSKNWDLLTIANEVWYHIKDRDWKMFPINGKTK